MLRQIIFVIAVYSVSAAALLDREQQVRFRTASRNASESESGVDRVLREAWQFQRPPPAMNTKNDVQAWAREILVTEAIGIAVDVCVLVFVIAVGVSLVCSYHRRKTIEGRRYSNQNCIFKA